MKRILRTNVSDSYWAGLRSYTFNNGRECICWFGGRCWGFAWARGSHKSRNILIGSFSRTCSNSWSKKGPHELSAI